MLEAKFAQNCNFSLFFPCLTGNLWPRPVGSGLRAQPGSSTKPAIRDVAPNSAEVSLGCAVGSMRQTPAQDKFGALSTKCLDWRFPRYAKRCVQRVAIRCRCACHSAGSSWRRHQSDVSPRGCVPFTMSRTMSGARNARSMSC